MTTQETNLAKASLKPQQIITLTKQLGAVSSYQEQIEILLAFLHNNFDVVGCAEVHYLRKSNNKTQMIHDPSFELEDLTHLFKTEPPQAQELEFHNNFWLILPLSTVEDEFGRIILKRSTPFGEKTILQIGNVLNAASPIIFTQLLKVQQRWYLKQLALVRSVSEKISQFNDLDTLTRGLTRLVQETFNYYYVAVFLIDQEHEVLRFKASAFAKDEPQQGLRKPDFEEEMHPGIPIGAHMIGYVAKTGEALVANDVEKEPRYRLTDTLPRTQSEVAFPLHIENDVIGVFDIQSDRLNAFDQNDLLVLRTLANHISIAIENTRLYQSMEKRAEQLSSVSEVSRAITVILDIDQLLQKVVELIHENFDFSYVHLFFVDPIHQKLIFKAGSGQRSAWYADQETSFDLETEVGVLAWVTQHKRSRNILDVEADPLYIKPAIADQVGGSELAVPLVFAGEILGVLDIQSSQTHAFSEDDQRLMETLADNIAIAIRNARLYRSESWRRQVAESMQDISGLLSENIVLSNLLDETLGKLQEILPCDIAGIWLFNTDQEKDIPPEEHELVLAASRTSKDYPDDKLGEMKFTPDDWVKHALKESFPTIRKPDETQGPIANRFDLSQNYSSIAAPLYTGEEILGMLTLDHHLPGKYGLESQKITSTFANYAAIAIKNTRLYTSSQEQAWISTILLQVATTIQSVTDLNDLIASIVRVTPMVVGIKGCAFLLREPENDQFSMYASYGISESGKELIPDHPLLLKDAPILQELLITNEPLRVRNFQDDFNLSEPNFKIAADDRLILLPLNIRNEILGAFLVTQEKENEPDQSESYVISEERYRIIQGIMQQTAVAIENIRLIEEKQEEAYVSNVLLQSAQTAVSSADIEDTLNSIVHIMPILVGIDASLIYLWDDVAGKFQITQAVVKGNTPAETLIGTTYSPDDFPMLDAVFENNHPIVYPFIESTLSPEDWDVILPDEGQVDPNPVLKSSFPVLMGFPLAMKDDRFGVLLTQDSNISTNRERRFELLWGMAQQASLAIQNDIINQEILERQRLEREFQLAREIQQTFLPSQIPDLTGWDMDVHWQTARQVGGDFYDYFLLSNNELAFVIADVSDKGLAASLYMAVTRTLLRTTALETKSPAKTLERVNDLLLINSQNGLFVTTFYGILNLSNGDLTFTIAGHNPPMLFRQEEQKVLVFEKGGIALGALPDITLPEDEINIKLGDCLVLYTDGVTEAFNSEDQMYGEERMIRVLEKARSHKAHNVVNVLVKDLEDFRDGAALSDDTTILTIYRLPD